MIQKALWKKTNDLKTHPSHANASTAISTAKRLLGRHSVCHQRQQAVEDAVVPLSVRATVEIAVFRELGFLMPDACLNSSTATAAATGTATAAAASERPHPTLLGTSATPMNSSANATTESRISHIQEQNQVAWAVALIWFALITGLVLWSLFAVLSVPRKREWENSNSLGQRNLNLVDEDTAWQKGFLSWVSLSWVDGLVGRYGKCLHAIASDNEIMTKVEKNYHPYVAVKASWEQEVKEKGVQDANLGKAVLRAVGSRPMIGLLAAVAIDMLFAMVGMVVALDKLMQYLERIGEHKEQYPDEPANLLEPTIVCILLLFGVPMCYRTASVVAALLDGRYNNFCAGGLAGLIFEKALNLPVGSGTDPEEEDVAHLLQADGQDKDQSKPSAVQLLNIDILEVWSFLLRQTAAALFAPVISLSLFGLLIKHLRLAGVMGFLYILPCTVAMAMTQMKMIDWWKRYQGFQDQRLRRLTETLLHIRTIKSLAWENLSFERLNNARQAELKCSQQTIVLGGFLMSILHTSPWLSLIIALWADMSFHGSIKAAKIIVVQRIVMSLLESLGIMQMGLRKFSQVPNSFRRIKTHMTQADRPSGVVRPPQSPKEVAVRLSGNFTFLEGKPPVLKGLDITIAPGELVAIVGSVASGKSALLQTVIGELFAEEGSFVEGPAPGSSKLAYCSQVPWIFEGTLKENVIIQNKYDEDRYHQALYDAALEPDLQILPGGDQVTIGNHGIRLSGGQRARVSLARAAYMPEMEVVCIDDPFASVDVPTGQHLMDELLLGPLMKGKTRIVVTQPNPTKLRSFDRVILIKDGEVAANGSPLTVMEHPDFFALLTSSEDVKQGDSSGRDTPVNERVKRGLKKDQNAEPATSLRDLEAQEHVTSETFRWWLAAAGYGNITFFMIMIMIQRWLMLRENLVLAEWIDAKEQFGDVDDKVYLLRTFSVMAMCCVVIILVAYGASRVSISAATKMHATVVYAILRAPIDKFFDKQPVGRLISRLSFDMRQVDDFIPLISVTLLMFIFGFIVTQSFIVSVMPVKIVLLALPLYACCFAFAWLYRGTAVPLVFHLKFGLSMLQDLQSVVVSTNVSVRANGMTEDFVIRYNQVTASISRSNYLIHFVCKAWVQSRIFLCLSTLTCIFAVGGLWTEVQMGLIGSVVSMSFQQMVEFENISTTFTQFLNILNALQRLTNYFKVPQEAVPNMESDPTVRLRVKMDMKQLPKLTIKKDATTKTDKVIAGSNHGKKASSSSFVLCLNDRPLLTATPDGIGLETVPGVVLKDVFPNCTELREAKGSNFSIVAVNSLTRDPLRMAEELACPESNLWLDLWNSEYASGMSVKLEGLTAGYGNDKNVLENVEVNMLGREKVGFAGKTGCGKSTTLLCILRILEPRAGRIMIGGIDSKKLGLSALRSMVGLVPQDPTVFHGSWRYNIDPFNEFPDGRIWEALSRVQLLPYILSLPQGVDSEIAADGGNISFGQRQLLSLARMVVRQPPILLLDECTSALDPSTQQAAQLTLLREFPMTTVIAIAHRVETILDFDRIVVFDKGSVAENGSVKNLMSIDNGLFRKLVDGSKGQHSPLKKVKE